MTWKTFREDCIEEGLEAAKLSTVRRMLSKGYAEEEILDLTECGQDILDRVKAEVLAAK